MRELEIQRALRARGFDPGPLDGVRGRRTIAAIERFQAANGLVVDGIVGPVTGRLLLGVQESVVGAEEMPWLDEARRLVGTAERPGSLNNDDIVQWAVDLDIDFGDDEIPWCGLFVAHCIGSQLTREPLPTVPLLARAWLKFGVPVTPQPGAVMVFWRGSRSSGSGHVGFYAGEEKDGDGCYRILGGNQSDKVCVTRIPKSKLLGARWPATVTMPAGRVNIVDAHGGELFNDAG